MVRNRGGRPSEEGRVRETVDSFLQAQVELGAKGLPISLNVVSKATGVSRNTLKKYALEGAVQIAAATQKREMSASKRRKDERVERLMEENVALKTQVAELQARLLLVEGNAIQYRIPADDLYRPIPVSTHESPSSGNS